MAQTSLTCSEQLYQKACTLIPGGVNSPVRACQAVASTPLFIKKGQGAFLTDVDGNTYLDFVLSWGPMILGHAHPSVCAKISKAVQDGTSYGAPCENEVKVAELICKALPHLDMVRMVNSGTEATMSAIRLARAVTKRPKILKFIGCYHGHADAFLAAAGSGVATLSLPGTPGVPEDVVAHTILAPYNDLDYVKEIFKSVGKELACVIVEPIAANMGLVLPKEGFLEGLRELCTHAGSLFILDEVITGFRAAFGGAHTRFGLEPDLTTLGKIIGGGLPVGAFGGKRCYMEEIAPKGPVYQAGTLSGNPLAMAAGLATLSILQTKDYALLETRTQEFAQELANILRAKQIPVQVPTIASMFSVFFTDTPVIDFATAKTASTSLFTQFYQQMRSQGIYLAPSSFETGMLSFAHTKDDLDHTLECAKHIKFN